MPSEAQQLFGEGAGAPLQGELAGAPPFGEGAGVGAATPSVTDIATFIPYIQLKVQLMKEGGMGTNSKV